MCFGCKKLGHMAVSCPKLRHLKRLRATREGGFVARRVRNYNRRKWYGGTSVSCQTNAFQEKMYTNLGNKWDSSQEKEGVGASVQDHVRNDPEVLEVVFRGDGEPCSLVIWVKIMGRKCKAVVRIVGHK